MARRTPLGGGDRPDPAARPDRLPDDGEHRRDAGREPGRRHPAAADRAAPLRQPARPAGRAGGPRRAGLAAGRAEARRAGPGRPGGGRARPLPRRRAGERRRDRPARAARDAAGGAGPGRVDHARPPSGRRPAPDRDRAARGCRPGRARRRRGAGAGRHRLAAPRPRRPAGGRRRGPEPAPPAGRLGRQPGRRADARARRRRPAPARHAAHLRRQPVEGRHPLLTARVGGRALAAGRRAAPPVDGRGGAVQPRRALAAHPRRPGRGQRARRGRRPRDRHPLRRRGRLRHQLPGDRDHRCADRSSCSRRRCPAGPPPRRTCSSRAAVALATYGARITRDATSPYERALAIEQASSTPASCRPARRPGRRSGGSSSSSSALPTPRARASAPRSSSPPRSRCWPATPACRPGSWSVSGPASPRTTARCWCGAATRWPGRRSTSTGSAGSRSAPRPTTTPSPTAVRWWHRRRPPTPTPATPPSPDGQESPAPTEDDAAPPTGFRPRPAGRSAPRSRSRPASWRLAFVLLALLLRRVRSFRHRRRGAPGAWAELLDALALAGVPADPVLPATAVADEADQRFGTRGARRVADEAERACSARRPASLRPPGRGPDREALREVRRAARVSVPAVAALVVVARPAGAARADQPLGVTQRGRGCGHAVLPGRHHDHEREAGPVTDRERERDLALRRAGRELLEQGALRRDLGEHEPALAVGRVVPLQLQRHAVAAEVEEVEGQVGVLDVGLGRPGLGRLGAERRDRLALVGRPASVSAPGLPSGRRRRAAPSRSARGWRRSGAPRRPGSAGPAPAAARPVLPRTLVSRSPGAAAARRRRPRRARGRRDGCRWAPRPPASRRVPAPRGPPARARP